MMQQWPRCVRFKLCRKKHELCLLLFALAFALVLISYHYFLRVRVPRWKSTFPIGRRGSSQYVTKFPLQRDQFHIDPNTTEHKVILLWTEFFGSRTWYTNENTFNNCPVKACSVTTDKKRVKDAHAVVMNVRDFSTPSDLPPSHPPWQVWILHGSEPPYYVWQDLRRYNNVFNWTSWYRTDADIFSPYGKYVTREEVDDSAVPDAFSLHDKLAFWAASNCYDMGRRYTRVAALQKYLPVDSYGTCGDLACAKGTSQCQKTLMRYKFVLAFENGYCRDYITEKLWNAYSRQQIPVVSGGADYSKFAIPGSYIDYDNFTSAGELAGFMLRVGSDRDLYNSFFKWKSKYVVKRGEGVGNWCQICEALHDKERQPQVYRDIAGWFAEDSCPIYAGPQQIMSPFLYYRIFKLLGL